MTRDKHKHDFDKIIKDALQEEFDNIEPLLSSNEAWEKFQNIKKKKSFSIFSSKKLLYPIYGFVLLFILLLITPNSSSAFSKVVDFFNTVQGNVANLLISNDSDKTESTLDNFSIEEKDYEVHPISMSLDEAKKELPFILLEPKWIPDHFHLEDIIVYKASYRPSNEVNFIYMNDEQKEFIIRQYETGDAYGFGVTLDTDDSSIKELSINGGKATLITHKSGFVELFWIAQDIYISIGGEISEEEAIKIAESM